MKPLMILLPAAALLSACERAEAPAEPAAPAAAEAPAAAAPATATATAATMYSCSNGQEVTAKYGADAAGKNSVTLTISGKDYVLNEVPSGSGARYTTENGTTPDMLLEWWTKGKEAMWNESPLDDSVTPEDTKRIATCTEKTAA